MGRAATGTLRKMDSGRWQARLTYPDEKRRSKTFTTKKDANAWLAGQVSDIERGVWKREQFEASVAVTFTDYAERWLKTRKVHGRELKPRTEAGYRDLLKRFIIPEFGQQALHNISRTDVDKWYDRTAVKTPTYRAKAYSLLKTILHTAVEDGHMDANPANIRGAGQIERQHIVRPASSTEVDAIAAAMPPRYRLLIQLAAWCALRYGELTELRRSDIDIEAKRIRIRRGVSMVNGQFIVGSPKTQAGIRDVDIPPHVMTELREHLLRFTALGPDGLLFPARNDPSAHMRQSSMFKVYYRARESAGRPDLRFHDLRHTGATWLAQEGATPAELMKVLGHTTHQASMRYQHAAMDRGEANAAALSKRYKKERKAAEAAANAKQA